MTPIRRRILLAASLGATGAALALPAYATVVEPWLRLVTVEHRPWPATWPDDLPLTIVALADVHFAEPQMSLARVEAIVDAANALRPDLVVLLGDYATSRRFVTRRVAPEDGARALAGLRAPLGVYSVLGNHDWWDHPDSFRGRRGWTDWGRALEAAGIPVLENDAVRLAHAGRAFWLLGLGDLWAHGWSARRGGWDGRDDLDGALAKVDDDAPAILLSHVPDVFPRVPRRVALTLSGHTHGGQVRLPGWENWVPSAYGGRYAHGHIVEGGRHLVVSGGLGTSLLPVRFGVPPEITVVRLGPPPTASAAA